MLKKTIGVLLSACALSTAVALPAQAVNQGQEGCTPGYWKNHTDNWNENASITYLPTMLLTVDPFNPGPPIGPFVPSSTDLNGDSTPDTFLDALGFPGGPGRVGAERILFRAAAAAWLNAAHEGVGYPMQRFTMVPLVNTAVATGNRATMLALATQLDANNNLGCPL